MTVDHVYERVVGLRYADLPGDVQAMAERCLLDLAGTAAAGAQTQLARVICDHAVGAFAAGAGAPSARLLFDGRRASPLGAALAGGMTIDSIDAHDGHVLTKGHAGVAILPGLLALVDSATDESIPPTGEEFLAALVVGYEVAIRAGIALHGSAPDYHTSGAWNALGVVAVAARLRALDPAQFRHALGIAEYHGPRSQMMRCIDHPTMLKDGSGWGAMVGVSSALLAAAGFTGAPAITVEAPEQHAVWADLGSRWRILELYFKPYPVCRWGQPAIEAALSVRQAHNVEPEQIESVRVHTFHEATRLDQFAPRDTEEAQYSLPFPVAVALLRGNLVPSDIAGESLTDPEVLSLSNRIELVDDPELSSRFPAERFARVELVLRDGSVVSSATEPARGDAERPLTDGELAEKYHTLATPALGPERALRLEEVIRGLSGATNVEPLVAELFAPLG